MKKFFFLIASLLLALCVQAQTPQKFSYQMVIRNASNQLLVGQTVGIKISILQGSANGSAVYAETHSPQTNANGLATLEIGGGSLLSGNFANINWANGPFFVKTETDPNGGNNYTITNTSQLLSVPYALYAASAGNNAPGPQGLAGQNGANGQNGTNGQNGLNCWDLDGDGVNDANEDVNNDGSWNVLDCRGSQGPAGNPATDDQNLSVSITGDTLYLQNGGYVIIPGISAANNGSSSSPLNIETAFIPAGSFVMGSPLTEADRQTNEEQHLVTLSAFRMSKFEISNSQFAAFLNAKSIGSNGLYALGIFPTQELIYVNSDLGLTWTGAQWQPVPGKENFPIVNVTWYGATEFANYVGGRLPSEAEWENACRGNSTTPFNTGNCLSDVQANYAWSYPYSGCINSNNNFPYQTQAINSYSSNEYGLFNMHGNVLEWCSDWFDIYLSEAQTNPSGPSTGADRILRGGSFAERARSCRSAMRQHYIPSETASFIGFRVAFAP